MCCSVIKLTLITHVAVAHVKLKVEKSSKFASRFEEWHSEFVRMTEGCSCRQSVENTDKEAVCTTGPYEMFPSMVVQTDQTTFLVTVLSNLCVNLLTLLP